MFICIDGIDGTGKSTIVRNLERKILDNFPSKKVITTKTPGGEPHIGPKARDIILNPEYTLSKKSTPFFFLADMIEVSERVVKPNIENGNIVITDRYCASTFAYQIMSEYFSMQEKCLILNCLMNFIYQPDYTFILDDSLEKVLERSNQSEYKKKDNMENCSKLEWESRRNAYHNFEHSDFSKLTNIKTINVDNFNPDQVTNIIYNFFSEEI